MASLNNNQNGSRVTRFAMLIYISSMRFPCFKVTTEFLAAAIPRPHRVLLDENADLISMVHLIVDAKMPIGPPLSRTAKVEIRQRTNTPDEGVVRTAHGLSVNNPVVPVPIPQIWPKQASLHRRKVLAAHCVHSWQHYWYDVSPRNIPPWHWEHEVVTQFVQSPS